MMGISKSNYFFKYHFPFILWLVIIFVQSSFPAIELPHVEIISSDKLIHAGVYGLLAALCYISLIHLTKEYSFKRYPFTWCVIITAAYGASDEIHQYFVLNRSAEVIDWIADLTGILIMMFIIRFFLKERYNLFKMQSV